MLSAAMFELKSLTELRLETIGRNILQSIEIVFHHSNLFQSVTLNKLCELFVFLLSAIFRAFGCREHGLHRHFSSLFIRRRSAHPWTQRVFAEVSGLGFCDFVGQHLSHVPVLRVEHQTPNDCSETESIPHTLFNTKLVSGVYSISPVWPFPSLLLTPQAVVLKTK